MKTLRAVNILMFVVVFCVKKEERKQKQKRSLITTYLCFIVYLQYLWSILFESMFSILNEKPYADMTSILFCVLLGVFFFFFFFFCAVFMHPFVVT